MGSSAPLTYFKEPHFSMNITQGKFFLWRYVWYGKKCCLHTNSMLLICSKFHIDFFLGINQFEWIIELNFIVRLLQEGLELIHNFIASGRVNQTIKDKLKWNLICNIFYWETKWHWKEAWLLTWIFELPETNGKSRKVLMKSVERINWEGSRLMRIDYYPTPLLNTFYLNGL